MSDTPMQPADGLDVGLPQLKRALRRTAKELRGTTARAAWYGLIWRWLAVVAVLFLLDLLFGLPVWLRWCALIGQAVFLVMGAGAALLRRGRLRVADEWAARVVEERHPELDNALINAIQFQRAVSGVEPSQAGLMRRELQRAEQNAAVLRADDSVDRAGEQTALRRMAALLAAWSVAAIVFSGVFMAVLPRLFLPWLDNVTPPYSPTHFDVRPAGATVRYGDSLTVTVRISGRMPENIALMTQSQGKDLHRIAMNSDAQDTYSARLDSLKDDTLYYVQGSTGRSARYRIVITRPPVVRSLRATYTYPTYTARPPATETINQTGLHGLAGTGAVLTVVSNRDLAGGELMVKTTEGATQRIPLQLDAKSPLAAAAHLTLSRPGEFRLALTATDGQVNPDAAHGKITIEKDQRPSVWFTFPAQDLMVTPDMKVPLRLQAEDDNGIEHVEVHRIINDLSDSPREFPSAPIVRKVGATLEMNMADLGVRAGDQITYHAAAYDNAPGKPNIGESQSYTIKVVSAEEFAKALREERNAADLGQETRDIAGSLKELAEQQEQLAQELERLQREQAKHPNDPGLQQQLAQARKAQKNLQQQAQKMAQSLKDYSQSPSGTDLERALKRKLAQIAQQMSATAQSAMQQAQSGMPGQAAANARAAARQLAKMNSQMAAQIQAAIEHLAEVLPLFNDLDRFMALLDQQGQLVLKARQFEQGMKMTAAEKARMDMLTNEQSRIAHELSQLQQDLVQHAAACEEHFPKAAASARKIAAEIGTRQIPQLMEAARDSFRQWDGPSGFESAQHALEQMQAMVGECHGGQGQASGELDIALSRSLGQRGLGSSLGQFSMNMGNNGAGMGMGGLMAGMTGQQGQGSAMRGPRPFTPSMQSLDGTGGEKRMQHANHIAGAPAGLSPKEVEVVKSTAANPRKAGDRDGSSYPPEYRKLVSEYFKSVAEHP
jgi:tetratricopeptide (TPR) repeat protein